MKPQVQEAQTDNFLLFEQILEDDFNHLFNVNYYPQSINFEFFNQFLESLRTTQDLIDIPENSRRFRIFLKCLLSVEKWNVYIILKWMVYVHSIIPLFHIPKLFQLIEQILNKLRLPNVKGKHVGIYENYLMNNLVKPYVQYISKLCSIKSKLLQQKMQIKIKENKQYKTDDEDKQIQKGENSKINAEIDKKSQDCDDSQDHLELSFQSFNLLTFALQEFPHVILETRGYLNSCFPYCSNFSQFIASDLKELFSILQRQHVKAGKHSFITLKEVQDFELKVNIFYQNTINHSKPYSIMRVQPEKKQNVKKHKQQSVLTDYTIKQNILHLHPMNNQVAQNKLAIRRRTASFNPESLKVVVHCTASCQDDQKLQVQQTVNQQSINLGSPIKPRLSKKITVEDENYFQELQIYRNIL